jgi:hypothetical protein
MNEAQPFAGRGDSVEPQGERISSRSAIRKCSTIVELISASAYPTLSTLASICSSGPNEVFAPDWHRGRRIFQQVTNCR